MSYVEQAGVVLKVCVCVWKVLTSDLSKYTAVMTDFFMVLFHPSKLHNAMA
jgi:hypothetical protein